MAFDRLLLHAAREARRRLAVACDGSNTLAGGAVPPPPTPEDLERNAMARAECPAPVPKPLYFLRLPKDFDYRREYLRLMEMLRPELIIETAYRGPGHPIGRKKRADGITLPSGIVLVAIVENLRAENPGLNNKSAMRKILENMIGKRGRANRRSKTTIQADIDRELKNLERDYYKALAAPG